MAADASDPTLHDPRPPADRAPAGAPPPPPEVGGTLGKYKILAELGAGGMGKVFRALDTVLGREIALKVLVFGPYADPVAMHRFLAEARSTARINHPNVVTIHEVAEVDRTTYIAMELVRGTGGNDLIKKGGPLDWRRAGRIVADACRGLGEAHAAGIVHRDVKPANLICLPDGGAKVVDFGLAKATSLDGDSTQLTRTGVVVCTPEFMSPEQCEPQPVDHRSDVYSLGGTYYCFLTGKSPYAVPGINSGQLMFCHLFKPPPDPRLDRPDLPEGCARIIAKAMAKAPADRYQTMAEMRADLEALDAGRAAVGAAVGATVGAAVEAAVGSATGSAVAAAAAGNSGTAPTVTDKAPPPRRAGSAVARAGAFALAAAVIGVAVWFGLRPPAKEPPPDAGRPEAPKVPDATVGPIAKVPEKVTGPDHKAPDPVRPKAEPDPEARRLAELRAGQAQRLALHRESMHEGRRDQEAGRFADARKAFAAAADVLHADDPGAAELVREAKLAGAGVASAEFAAQVAPAREAIAKGRYAEGLEGLTAALPAAPDEAARVQLRKEMTRAQVALGEACRDGRGVTRDFGAALKHLQTPAEDGDPQAQADVALHYGYGLGVARNDETAARWARRAAEQGHPAGMELYASLLKTGDGIPKDEAAAADWFRKAAGALPAAAEGDDPMAQTCLAAMYTSGNVFKADPRRALELYLKAADRGFVVAMAGAGTLLAGGQDEKEAVRWFRKAADAELPIAQAFLAVMYAEGRGVAKDEAEAVKLFRKAGAQDVDLAALWLGVLYAAGRGVAKDEVEAVKWLRKAAERGQAQAQAHLGAMYAAGLGVARDDAEAVKWFRKSAGQGDPSGQYSLGVMLATGRGAAKDDVEAVNWYRKAAAQGLPAAKAELSRRGVAE